MPILRSVKGAFVNEGTSKNSYDINSVDVSGVHGGFGLHPNDRHSPSNRSADNVSRRDELLGHDFVCHACHITTVHDVVFRNIPPGVIERCVSFCLGRVLCC